MKSYIVRNTGFLLPTSKKNGLLLSFVTGFSSLTLKIYEIIMHYSIANYNWRNLYYNSLGSQTVQLWPERHTY